MGKGRREGRAERQRLRKGRGGSLYTPKHNCQMMQVEARELNEELRRRRATRHPVTGIEYVRVKGVQGLREAGVSAPRGVSAPLVHGGCLRVVLLAAAQVAGLWRGRAAGAASHPVRSQCWGGDAQRELVPPRLIPPDSPAPLPRLVAPGAADADGRRRWRGRVSAVAGVVGGALVRLGFLANPHAPRRE